MKRKLELEELLKIQSGVDYLEGKGVKRNLTKAIELLKDTPDGQFFLGASFHGQHKANKDLKKALYWYEKAASNGHGQAQYNLALMYANDEWKDGVDRDIFKAYHWISKAAENNIDDAKETKEQIFNDLSIEELEELYNPKSIPPEILLQYLKRETKRLEEFRKSKSIAPELIEIYAEKLQEAVKAHQKKRNDDLEVIKEPIELLKKGSQEEALIMLEELYEKNNPRAALFLGSIYYQGQYGVIQDFKKAKHWFEIAATESNDATAQGALGLIYLKGEGVKKNIFDAYLWSDRSVKNGGDEKSIKLKKLIEESLSTENLKKAKEYVKMDYELKDLDSQIDDMFKIK